MSVFGFFYGVRNLKKWSQGNLARQMAVSRTLKAVCIKAIVFQLKLYSEFGMGAVTKQPFLWYYFKVVLEDLKS